MAVLPRGRTTGITVQAGHHSNGQSGCLLRWTRFAGEESGKCADHASAEELRSPFATEADTNNGNFSLNYFRVTFDQASYGFLGVPAGRLSLGLELNPLRFMYEPMRARYPRWRFPLGLGLGLADVGFCARFDFFIKIRWGSEVSGSGQITCVWSEERGLGVFVRGYAGSDEYNSSYFGENVNRVEAGFTINRIRTFGIDYGR